MLICYKYDKFLSTEFESSFYTENEIFCVFGQTATFQRLYTGSLR